MFCTFPEWLSGWWSPDGCWQVLNFQIFIFIFVCREVRLMVETQIKCLMQDLLPALKKEGLNLLDYNKLHHHQKEQVSRSLWIFHAKFYMMIFFSKFLFLFSVFQRNFFDQKWCVEFITPSGMVGAIAAQAILQVILGAHTDAIGCRPWTSLPIHWQLNFEYCSG